MNDLWKNKPQEDRELKPRRELTEKQILFKTSALCSLAEHCEHEIREKMRRWEVEEEVQDRVIAELIANKFIDEARYTQYFIREKLVYNKWGRRKIEMALAAKHINKELVRNMLDEIDEEQFLEVLRPLLVAKARTIKTTSKSKASDYDDAETKDNRNPAGNYEKRAKLIRFALGKGFLYEQIELCLKEIL